MGRKEVIMHLLRVLSKPGMWFQKLTTREPDHGYD